MTQTFWLEPSEQMARGLRRYSHGEGGWTCAEGYHSALVYVDRVPARYTMENGRRRSLATSATIGHLDERWPRSCERCDYVFGEGDVWQDWTELIYSTGDGREYVLHQNAGADSLGAPAAPPGACWDAWWLPFWRGVDGVCLMVRLPNGHDWMVDSRANNCTLPDDDVHRCWVRHGDPRECRVTVDKNGVTCAAGAGSIQGGDWHGFLRDGVLA